MQEGPMPNVWGFIDGTARAIARPKRGQRLWYSGHKRHHVQKFQGVTTPFGIIVHLFGPIEGSRHDAALLSRSGLLADLEEHLPPRGENPDDVFALFGDGAYPLRAHLQIPFGGANLTQQQLDFNTRMKECRICIKWAFAEIAAKFAYVDLKRHIVCFMGALLSTTCWQLSSSIAIHACTATRRPHISDCNPHPLRSI